MEEVAAVQSIFVFSADSEEGAAVQSRIFFQMIWKRALLSDVELFFSADVEEGATVQS